MEKKSDPVITKYKQSENWTKVTFKPDLEKLKMAELEDVVVLMEKWMVDMAGCLGKTVKVELNGKATKAIVSNKLYAVQFRAIQVVSRRLGQFIIIEK
ncbi:hypothetical protein HN873_032843, partial [Arachis hypogaea]